MLECIICRKEKDDLSDEHVIPDALGGYYHIHTVCKKCNSKLGSYVDTKLVNHLFSTFQRYSTGLKGKSGTIPNPFSGTHTLKDDEEQKVRLEKDENGVFVPYLIMGSPDVTKENDKTTITIKIDARDKNKLPSIIKKIAKRNNFNVEDIQIDTDLDKYSHKFRPEVIIKTSVDLDEFKIGLLKIAYEFAVDSIPEYYNDEKAILISKDLENCKITTNDLFIGSGFDKDMFNAFKFILDISSNKHYLILCHTKKLGLICMIYLSNTFSIGVKLSTNEYLNENFIFGINDIENKNFEKLDINQIHERIYSPMKLRYGYLFQTEDECQKFKKIEQSNDFEFYKDTNGNQPLYDKDGNAVYSDINEKLEVLDNVSILDFDSKDLISEVNFEDEELYIKIKPDNILLRVVVVRSEQYYIGSI
ncbi:MAG: HNH endonuclease [Campylobacteraceae bacterium]|nr:HNH endonuclease [Campylobacteraceae bacterium]